MLRDTAPKVGESLEKWVRPGLENLRGRGNAVNSRIVRERTQSEAYEASLAEDRAYTLEHFGETETPKLLDIHARMHHGVVNAVTQVESQILEREAAIQNIDREKAERQS